MADEMKPAYLIAGTDGAKIDAARARLRVRAESEGGAGALESFDAEGGAPDATALVAALPAMSLSTGRRYLLADGVEAWKVPETKAVAEGLGSIPDDTTVVLIARGKAPAALAKAIKLAGGEALSYQAPRDRDLPGRLVSGARERGFELEQAGARMLAERLGNRPVRLANELDRLALWAGKGGRVTAADLEAMVADTSETASWALSDALLDGDGARVLSIAERLVNQEESLTGLLYGLASRLRKAQRAIAGLEAGRPQKEIEGSLEMHPYAARKLLASVRDADPAALRAATCALADLEVWTRGGADYEEDVALTLALRRAAGVTA